MVRKGLSSLTKNKDIMNAKLVYVLAGALTLGFTTFSHAEDKPSDKPEGRPQRGNFSPEQREKAAKELGLDPEQLKTLSPEERMAKFKEASDKKLAELEKKKADGTITDSEKETLKRLEMRKQWAGQREGGPGASPEQREKILKDLGLKAEDLKDLPPQERMAKVREAAKAKTEELKKKQTDGTITDAEKETLKRLEQRQQFMQGRGDHGPRHGEKSGDDKK